MENTNKTAFVNGMLLDGSEDMTAKAGKVILTEGGRITAIEDGSTAPKGYDAIDLGGRFIMPGLVNMHVHIPASGKPTKKPKDNAKTVRTIMSTALTRKIAFNMCEGYAKTELLSGVTTIRAVGGIADYDSRLRDKIAAGEATGPRILAANMAVSVPGGHMAGSLAYEAKSAEEARGFVAKIAKDKPDLIKIMITGGVLDATKRGEPGELKMAPELVKAACDEAHSLGLIVAAHVESPEGVRIALENGVDTIEHGAEPDDGIIELFRKRNACLIATLSPALPYALFDRSISRVSEIHQFNGKVVFDGIIDCAKSCLKNGIPVGLGTDTGCPYTTHYDMWRELAYFHKYCGVTNKFALYTATKLNARLGGLGDVTGSIEPGMAADMIVTAKDPLDDLSALRTVDMVVARGRIFDRPRVKKMKNVETELDKFL